MGTAVMGGGGEKAGMTEASATETMGVVERAEGSWCCWDDGGSWDSRSG
jgi:hypothetical protein